MFARFAFLIALLLCVGQIFAGFVRMEPSVNTFSSQNWIKEKTLTEKDTITAIFALKRSPAQVARLERELLARSTPSNSMYGKWLSKEEIKAQFSPSVESVKTVTDFLDNHGVKDYKLSALGDSITVTMPVKTANTVFDTEFASFRSVTHRNVVVNRVTKPYHLPEEVAKVVSVVDNIMRFPPLRESAQSFGYEETVTGDAEFNSCGTKCAGNTTPDVLRKAYSFGPVSSVSTGNSMSVAEFQTQFWDQTDLDAFSGACGVKAEVYTTIGTNNPSFCSIGGCVEALLDIEYIEAIANPIPLTVIFLSTYSLLDWADKVNSLPNPPLVHSVSYGNDEVQQTTTDYMDSVNQQFMILGLNGLSVLFASGDQGVWGRTGVGSTYHPDFPAASPYVTAVGGTDFATKSVIGEETAWSCGGGGFSDHFAMPSWQSGAVNNYLTAGASAGILPSSTLFNSTGRAYPDLAALGGQVNPYCVSSRGGSFGGVAGTSASCPVVAGIIAQLNNVRLANGKTSLGWLNPFIYSTAASAGCFNDVKDGSMNNCNRGTVGFVTTAGWDPATGFGSPNYECLAKLM